MSSPCFIKLISDGHPVLEMQAKLKSKWRKLVTGDEKKRIRDLIIESQEKPENIKLFDKIAFTFGVLNIGACQFVLFNLTGWFWVWYSFVIPLLLIGKNCIPNCSSSSSYFLLQ
jgi:hypothetical protein